MAKILLIDDEPDILITVGQLLDLENHEVTRVQQSDTAVDMIKQDDFDLMITDMRMRPLNGLDLLKVARDAKPDMHVIIITAYHTPQIYREIRKLGAFAYVPKPFKIDQFLSVVNKALGVAT